MKSHRQPVRRPVPIAIAALALCLAAPALGAELTEVRVGAHRDYTRVVFELDRATGYRVERVGGEGSPALRVSLDASSRGLTVNSRGDVRSLRVEPGVRAVAHISLSAPGLRLQEMILANPPRIVLDIMRSEPQAAAVPATKPQTVAKRPAPAPAPSRRPAAKPPAEKPAAGETARPTPAPQERPAAKPAEAKPPTLAKRPEAPAPPDATPAPGSPEPTATDRPTSSEEAARRRSRALAVDPREPAGEPREAGRGEPPSRLSPPPRPAAPPPRPTARPTLPVQPAPAEPMAESDWRERLPLRPTWLGAIAGALLALLAIFFVARRRQPLPNDLDVAAIAEEVEGPGAQGSVGRDEAFETSPVQGSDESSFGGLFDEPEAASAPAPTPSTDSTLTAGPGAGVVASQGDAPMERDMDLPADPTMSPPPPPSLGGAAAPPSDVVRLIQELAQRLESVESRLDESNEAREKLERQVAAQSEELRVQRAAIARTQRALRTMNRPDEDKATEPALRDDAKTRANV